MNRFLCRLCLGLCIVNAALVVCLMVINNPVNPALALIPSIICICYYSEKLWYIDHE